MKILIVGTFPRADGEIEIGQFLQKSCENMRLACLSLGHAADTFHYRAIAEESRRWGHWEYRLQKFCRRWLPGRMFRLPGIRKMNQLLLAKIEAGGYDLVLLAKTDLVDPDLIPLFNQYTRTWYFLNDWIIIARNIRADKLAAKATWASATRSNVVTFFEKAGARAQFLTQGANTDVFYPDESVPREYDVVFVGTLREDRKEYLDYLKAGGIKVATFGKDMEHGHVFGPRLAHVYRQARIVLNFNTTISKVGFSLRVFEVMGCGAFMLTEHCKDLETLFKNREELVWFKNPEECLAAIREFLEKEDERETIARTGLARIREEFTWEHIIGKICEKVKEESGEN